ncbi:hypothetical protein [Nocardioides bruguierae]|uniref:Uncharacterized protein n=1 Tax=Nocardioides bruguierae TaxID=2945102 RepID=A0A9X2IEL2_9ACTN|nr:hypothetical protein [Nocardioides bruguierae]MCM0618730.1 hypothetical protein [Nocardioides bruguierae]
MPLSPPDVPLAAGDLGGDGGGLPSCPSAATTAALRRAVYDLATGERRRRPPARLHVGLPGGRVRVLAADRTDLDAALRTDLLVTLLLAAWQDLGARPLVWLTRTGPLDLQDADAAWLSAARAAAAELGSGLVFVVVTRSGWWDPRSGTTRRWKRMRRR